MSKEVYISSALRSKLTERETLVYKQTYSNCLSIGMSSYAATNHSLEAVYADRDQLEESIYKLEPASTLFMKEEDKRLVFGFFSVVEKNGTPVVDHEGDSISEEELEKAAYEYVRNSGMGDERHDGRCKAVLVESMVFTKEKQDVLGIDLGLIGWWGGFYVTDEAMWQKVKKGDYAMFSIGGVGIRE